MLQPVLEPSASDMLALQAEIPIEDQPDLQTARHRGCLRRIGGCLLALGRADDRAGRIRRLLACGQLEATPRQLCSGGVWQQLDRQEVVDDLLRVPTAPGRD